MGRRREGEQVLTGAERQARYRARHGLAAAPPRPPSRLRPLSRIQRWTAAVRELAALQAEYAEWFDALPDATRDSPTGQALQAMLELDLDELLTVQLPRGFGRD